MNSSLSVNTPLKHGSLTCNLSLQTTESYSHLTSILIPQKNVPIPSPEGSVVFEWHLLLFWEPITYTVCYEINNAQMNYLADGRKSSHAMLCGRGTKKMKTNRHVCIWIYTQNIWITKWRICRMVKVIISVAGHAFGSWHALCCPACVPFMLSKHLRWT